MVPTLTIIALLFGAIVCVAVPTLLYVWMRKRANQLLLAAFAGGLGFFVMQIVIRIPIVQVVAMTDWFANLAPFLAALLLGSTAALFETVGRYGTMVIFLKDDKRFSAAFAHGVWHGGVEAIMLVGLNFGIYAVFAILLNIGLMDGIAASFSDSTTGLGETISLLTDVLTTTPWHEFLWGTFERVVTIFIHVGLSVLVMFSRYRRQFRYTALAFLIHMTLDTLIVVLAQQGMSILIIELTALAFAICAVIIIIFVYREYKKDHFKQEEVNAHD